MTKFHRGFAAALLISALPLATAQPKMKFRPGVDRDAPPQANSVMKTNFLSYKTLESLPLDAEGSLTEHLVLVLSDKPGDGDDECDFSTELFKAQWDSAGEGSKAERR